MSDSFGLLPYTQYEYERGLPPICDRCETPLVYHGDTLRGAGCDLDLALSDLWRALLMSILGERLGWRVWWAFYDRKRNQ